MPKYGKTPRISSNVLAAITEYNNDNNELYIPEICEKYGITRGQFIYGNYSHPGLGKNRESTNRNLESDNQILETKKRGRPKKIKGSIKKILDTETETETEKLIIKRSPKQQGGNRLENEPTRYVKEPIPQRRGSWAGKDSNHPMYKAIISQKPTKKIVNVEGVDCELKKTEKGVDYYALSGFLK